MKPLTEQNYFFSPLQGFYPVAPEPVLLKGSFTGADALVKEDTSVSDEEKVKKEELIICRSCKNIITSPKESISIDGRHSHTFMNPAGLVYRIGCFAHARGCSLFGPSSGEYTWFPGYIWTVAICSTCSSHLGWKFTSGGSVFFGLILDNLADN